VEFDPYSYELDRDPYPVYRFLRDEQPVYRNERLDFWALSRFDDVLAASLDWRSYSSAQGTVLELMGRMQDSAMIIFMDPPRQTRLRNLVSKAFTPRRMAGLAKEIREIARGYLDPLLPLGGCNIVRDFTSRLPMDVISAMLGIPSEDREQVQRWSNETLHREPGNPDPPAVALRAMADMFEYMGRQIAERRARPRDDMITLLTQAELPGDDGGVRRLSELEIHSFITLLAAAGNETVTKLLATAIYWLWKHPEQRARLLAQPQLIPNAVEETLRFDPPSQYQGRVTTREIEIHGRTLPVGARVLLLTGSSGRDERRFPDPDRYDVGREIDLHLGFGYGQHICLGASLARLEMATALDEFLQRFPDYEIDEDGIERVHSSNVRGFAGVPLRYAARQGETR
jgi:cytochrome P450